MTGITARNRPLSRIFWPSMGWWRLGRYLLHRLTRLKATPHAIALGVAFGVFSSFTPFMGFHIAIAALLTYIFGGNIIAAGVGTLFGNPLTFPFIWLMTYNIGEWFSGARGIAGDMPQSLTDGTLYTGSLSSIFPVLTKMLLGALPLGLMAALLCYFPLKLALAGLQHKRQQRLTGKSAKDRKAVHVATPAMS